MLRKWVEWKNHIRLAFWSFSRWTSGCKLMALPEDHPELSSLEIIASGSEWTVEGVACRHWWLLWLVRYKCSWHCVGRYFYRRKHCLHWQGVLPLALGPWTSYAVSLTADFMFHTQLYLSSLYALSHNGLSMVSLTILRNTSPTPIGLTPGHLSRAISVHATKNVSPSGST